MLNRLKGQASDLELLLDQLNALEASLDDAVLAPPAAEDTVEREARQAKRAAKRAERRATATAATVQAPAFSDRATWSEPAPSPSASASLSSFDVGISETASSSSSASSTASDVQHLEELFKLTAFEPDLPASAPAPQPAASAPAPAPAAVLRPRKPARKPAAPPAAAAVEAPPAPAPAPAERLADQFNRWLGAPTASPEEDQVDLDLDAAAGPSEADLRALLLEVEAEPSSSLDGEDQDPEFSIPGAAEDDDLEASAMAPRTAEQLAVMQAGPSLLSLVPSTAAQGRTARVRQARRSARYGARTVRAGGAVDGSGRAAKLGRDGTNQFMSSTSNVAVLDADVEREVTEVCRDFLFLEKVKRQCAKTLHRKPNVEEVAAAVGMDVPSYNARYDAGLKAKELLLKSNYKLVMTVCKKYIGKGAQLQDLLSEGVKGLLRSVEKYDASKGFRFGTYAHWWIRQAISRSLAETGRAVRLPVHMIEQLTKLKNATAELSAKLNRDPDLEELSAAVGLPVTRIQLLMDAARSASSLDTPLSNNDQGATAKDNVEDERAAADEEFGSSSLKGDMEGMLADLTEREAKVVRLRFGLEDGKEWTLEDIGDALSVTRERIRQIEAKALRKLQVLSVDASGKLREYSDNLHLLESREMAARTSSGTRKT
ncbi:hypothetical protein HYH03_017357 [Edaphochlamys debaryana]|uniref:RNA polymerase sigma-70 domain-containing protein n=1 Tax=Edaphochlamys debaryana TaxID=47281 RepID=A0A836BQJ5_9CHLO|nr:hypothetical protein HYH03_017357 [Edaphochlamys debaryana]|eukprot:KAG2483834.1 hypothetical protein HYH03_017357 [Edaphochlamys debaryana]